MTANMPEENDHSALLVRDAMERTVADLPPSHDLVPAAVAQGQRRRLRARLVIATGSACVAGAVVAACLTVAGGGDSHTSVRPAASATPSPHHSHGLAPEPGPYRTPLPAESMDPGDLAIAQLSAADRKRREEFQQRAAVLLDRLLPDSIGFVHPVRNYAQLYNGESAGGRVFELIFTVRSSKNRPGPRPCFKDIARKGGTCEYVTLPGGSGVRATSLRLRVEPSDTMSTQIAFTYAHSEAVLTVYPDVDAGASSPVTGEELEAAVGDPRFLDLVRDAAALPLDLQEAIGADD
ncbi:hypothetical protein [Streptomyces sp. NPDC059466]|uniref:hypothetical protein n=1 Tax=unclassified Streptomyces TaxID=2593676 RepID=UPI0036744562